MNIRWTERRYPDSRDPFFDQITDRYRAFCSLDEEGRITGALLYRWGTIKHVCFGRGQNVHGWIPTEHLWRAAS